MFRQQPQSPESRSEDPRVTRITKVSLAVGFLNAAIEANQSREVAILPDAPITIDQPYMVEFPRYETQLSQEDLLAQARVSAERARAIHGQYTTPAEDMTDEFADAQKMLRRDDATPEIIPFPQQLEQHNPIIKRAA